MLVTEEWKAEFVEKIHLWAESFEWLYGNSSFMRDASIIIERLK